MKKDNRKYYAVGYDIDDNLMLHVFGDENDRNEYTWEHTELTPVHASGARGAQKYARKCDIIYTHNMGVYNTRKGPKLPQWLGHILNNAIEDCTPCSMMYQTRQKEDPYMQEPWDCYYIPNQTY